MLKFYAVAIHHMGHPWLALLVCLVHLVWLVQSARLLAMLASGNWNGEPMVYPRLLALLRRRKTPRRTDDKTTGRAWKDKSS